MTDDCGCCPDAQFPTRSTPDSNPAGSSLDGPTNSNTIVQMVGRRGQDPSGMDNTVPLEMSPDGGAKISLDRATTALMNKLIQTLAAGTNGVDTIQIAGATVVGVHNTIATSAVLTLQNPLDLANYKHVLIESVPAVWLTNYIALGSSNYVGQQTLEGKVDGSWQAMNPTTLGSGILTDVRVSVSLANSSDDLTADY